MKLKKMRIILTLVGFLLLLYILFKIFSFLFIPAEQVTNLPTKNILVEYTKIEIKPLPLKKGNDFGFLITIQSNQEPDILSLDLKTTSLLEDNSGNDFEAKSWIILKKDLYKVQGKLFFNHKFNSQKFIKLNLFDGDNFTVKWNLK